MLKKKTLQLLYKCECFVYVFNFGTVNKCEHCVA